MSDFHAAHFPSALGENAAQQEGQEGNMEGLEESRPFMGSGEQDAGLDVQPHVPVLRGEQGPDKAA